MASTEPEHPLPEHPLPEQTTATAGSDDRPSIEERAVKRQKLDDAPVTKENGASQQNGASNNASDPATSSNGKTEEAAASTEAPNRRPGTAPIKKEYLIHSSEKEQSSAAIDDDAAEARGGDKPDDRDSSKGKGGKKDRKKQRGQNTERTFGNLSDSVRLCHSRAFYPEFSPRECQHGDRCKLSHDLRAYLDEGRRGDVDVEVFSGRCPVYEAHGRCASGWKCRFVRSHMREVERDDGLKELVLLERDPNSKEGEDRIAEAPKAAETEDCRPATYNIVGHQAKIDLSRKRVDFSRTDQYIQWLGKEAKALDALGQRRKDGDDNQPLEDLRAQFVDPPFLPSEKRRLYFGPETPALAPLTTQGNLPFRRLCVELGAQLTYSEMALGLPLVQGTKSDWTLTKAHESEIAPPVVNPSVVFEPGYDHARDLRFGAQISANAPWAAVKAADVLNRYCPHLRLIDLNCGCPIDMVFKSGGGSALLDAHGKLERMVRGMNAVSGEIPITAKIRTGVKPSRPTAPTVLSKLAFGPKEHRDRLGAPGCAAVTLHGRNREQRYTKRADWAYIGECAALVKSYNEQKAALTDTAADPDPRTLPNARDGRMFFLGNGDCYSHVEYHQHIDEARVDSVMIGRGALIKPWLFEEIEKGQYLDKSATERLSYVERFVRYGLDAWGSDEVGIGFTRRFLLEWLSFAQRYVPIGLLEHLPPSLNDRPPMYRGRNELETLMASDNYKDWIKISEMFLGPVQEGFRFLPKHKSNAYEAEG